MASNPIGWFEIYVQDMERAKKFYTTVLGAQLERLESPGVEMWSFPMNPESTGASGALVHAPEVPSGGNSTMVYFNCDDCSAEAGRVAGAGGRIEKEKFSIGPYGFVVLAYDTEGNRIGLHSMK